MLFCCILCNFLVFCLTLTKTIGTPLSQAEVITPTSAKLMYHQPQTHILSLLKQNKANKKYFEFDNDYKNDRRQQTKAKIIEKTDDLLESKRNTLENTDDEYSRLRNETNSGVYLRFKQSIPVLEPVRHLLNAVREGGFNHTAHFNKTRHQLVNPGEVPASAPGVDNSSSAIETEAERDMVLHGSGSTNFQLLDFFGSIGSMIWSFLMNIKKFFAASSGNASAAFSGGSF